MKNMIQQSYNFIGHAFWDMVGLFPIVASCVNLKTLVCNYQNNNVTSQSNERPLMSVIYRFDPNKVVNLLNWFKNNPINIIYHWTVLNLSLYITLFWQNLPWDLIQLIWFTWPLHIRKLPVISDHLDCRVTRLKYQLVEVWFNYYINSLLGRIPVLQLV